MADLRLTLACWDYDRTRALMDGSVRPDGIELVYLNQPVEETFFRMMKFREFDCSEMSLSSYTASLGQKNPPFIALPVFVGARGFTHKAKTRSWVADPEDSLRAGTGKLAAARTGGHLPLQNFQRGGVRAVWRCRGRNLRLE